MKQIDFYSAFAHYTYFVWKRKAMVLDIQGVGYMLTDPQVASVEEKKYHYGNLGAIAISTFFEHHICSEICQVLGIHEYRSDVHNYEEASPQPAQVVASKRAF